MPRLDGLLSGLNRGFYLLAGPAAPRPLRRGGVLRGPQSVSFFENRLSNFFGIMHLTNPGRQDA